MEINKLLKKRMCLFAVSLVLVSLLTITSTYAFMNNDFVENHKVINNQNLRTTYEQGHNNVNICSYPLSFQQGNQESPENVIRIVNKGPFSTNFLVQVKKVDENVISIDHDKIFYSINNSEPELLSTLKDDIIYSANIKPNEEYILDIKMWVSSELISNDDQGKSVNLKFEVINK